MSFNTTVPFQGDAQVAVNNARAVLVGQGFRVQQPQPNVLFAKGPRVKSGQNPLRGAGVLTLVVQAGELHLTADLRGQRSLAFFVVMFPPVLVLLLGLILGTPGGEDAYALYCMGAAASFLPFSWMLVRHMRRRARESLDVFAGNIAQLGSS